MLLLSPGVPTNSLVCQKFKELFYSPTPAQRWVIIPVKQNVSSDSKVCQLLDKDNNEYNYSKADDYIEKISESGDRGGPFLAVWRIDQQNRAVEYGYFNFSNITPDQLNSYLDKFKAYSQQDDGKLKSGPVIDSTPIYLWPFVAVHGLLHNAFGGAIP